MLDVVIFGTGSGLGKIEKYFNYNKLNILAYLDNNPAKQGTYLNGIEVINPKYINNYRFHYIIILSEYYEDIYLQLKKSNVLDEKIIIFYKISAISSNSFIDYFGNITNYEGIEDIFNCKICKVRKKDFLIITLDDYNICERIIQDV